MARTTRPAASDRPPRSFWFDPRFGVGLVLIVASVAGVGWIVGTADRTVDVWAAAKLLTPGEHVHESDLVIRAVRLGEVGDLYLASDAVPDEGLIVARTVAEGELVPAASVGRASSAEEAAVVVAVSAALPRSIGEGAVVDLWSASSAEGDSGFGPPGVLVAGATVVRIVEDDGLIVDGGATSVEVMVPRAKLAAVLDAITGEDALSLVPAVTPLGG